MNPSTTNTLYNESSLTERFRFPLRPKDLTRFILWPKLLRTTEFFFERNTLFIRSEITCSVFSDQNTIQFSSLNKSSETEFFSEQNINFRLEKTLSAFSDWKSSMRYFRSEKNLDREASVTESRTSLLKLYYKNSSC